jgi:hypothetical protein
MITSIHSKEEYKLAAGRLEELINARPGSAEEEEYNAIVLSMKIYNIEKYEGSEVLFDSPDGI